MTQLSRHWLIQVPKRAQNQWTFMIYHTPEPPPDQPGTFPPKFIHSINLIAFSSWAAWAVSNCDFLVTGQWEETISSISDVCIWKWMWSPYRECDAVCLHITISCFFIALFLITLQLVIGVLEILIFLIASNFFLFVLFCFFFLKNQLLKT